MITLKIQKTPQKISYLLQPSPKIIYIVSKLCNLFCVAQSTWKCDNSSKETLYIWYVVEKQPKEGGFGS